MTSDARPPEDTGSPATPAAAPREAELRLGIVLRRIPSKNRWVSHVWRAVAVLPGAPPADWVLLREEDGAQEYHAATMPLVLHRSEAESYRVALAGRPRTVWVVLRPAPPGAAQDIAVRLVTASPFEAQDYMESGEELVEPVPMPEALEAWIAAFTDAQPDGPAFVKRRRVPHAPAAEDGLGDRRIAQESDVYRAPSSLRDRKDMP
ncbi:DUF3305 domain-containing protein [Paroceanicella profunda]|uniref:DUF3305 domain-containing protein n=1 Tax=Paroceanicella profunda TaxID=2579971 RepID=UPI001EF14587|nr:DUF3305 domain-containing protein [Paroceanicella profunda]